MVHEQTFRARLDGSMPVVFVVEDNDDLREMMVAWIEKQGFQVVAAANGIEALACLRRGPRPVLIVLDLKMPEMDGREVLSWLKRQGELSTIPVVVVSGEEERPGAEDYFLKKPVDCDVLIRILQAHCHHT